MVLLGTKHSYSAFGLFRGVAKRGLHLEALSILTLQNIFFNLCKACQLKMSCYPPSMFSAGRMRDTQRGRDKQIANSSKIRPAEPIKYFNTSLMELTPLKYNSKLMNSIWGFYNRYSPHNVKKINDVFSFKVECQQSAGNSTKIGEPVVHG